MFNLYDLCDALAIFCRRQSAMWVSFDLFNLYDQLDALEFFATSTRVSFGLFSLDELFDALAFSCTRQSAKRISFGLFHLYDLFARARIFLPGFNSGQLGVFDLNDIYLMSLHFFQLSVCYVGQLWVAQSL